MSFQKTLRIFFFIFSLLFAQHAAALHLFTHALQVNDRVEQTAERRARQRVCQLAGANRHGWQARLRRSGARPRLTRPRPALLPSRG